MENSKIHVATYQREKPVDGITVAQHFTNDLGKKDFYGNSIVIRFGGTMPYKAYNIEVNTAEAVKNSIDKRKQKDLLIAANIPVQPNLDRPVFPCVLKGVVRSGGENVFLCKTQDEYNKYSKKLVDFITEPLFNTTSEYRLHCTKDQVFFAVKKHKRNQEDIIITRYNHYNKKEFLKPRLWEKITATCVKAINALKLDIGCFDVLYDSSNNDKHEFVISECNTNPEFLNNTYNAYLNVLPPLIYKKIEEQEKKPCVKEKKILTKEQVVKAVNNILLNNYIIEKNNIILSL